MKSWVSSGRWQEFMKRESAQDFKDLSIKQLLQKKILTKVMAKKVGRRGHRLKPSGSAQNLAPKYYCQLFAVPIDGMRPPDYTLLDVLTE